MLKNSRISLHPRLSGVLEALISTVFFILIFRVSSGWLLVVMALSRMILWVALATATFYPPFLSRFSHLLSLALFSIASVSVLFLTVTGVMRFIIILLSIALTAMSFFLLPSQTDIVPALGKPERRIRWLMTLSTVAGTWCTLFSLATFQIITGRWLVFAIIVGTMLVNALGAWWWYSYEPLSRQNLFLGYAVMCLIMSGVATAIILLPLGYFTNTFLFTWLWYDVWVLLRFYFSKEGIRWENQRLSLAIQAVLFFLVMIFVVRWR